MLTRRLWMAGMAGWGYMGTAAETPRYRDHADLLHWLDSAGQKKPVRNKKDWMLRRRHVLASMQQVMGPLPSMPSGAPRVEVVEEHEEASYTRRKVRYESEAGDSVPAWLLIPKPRKGKMPAVVCCHQTTRIGKDEPAGMGGKPNLHYAKELAELGFVTLAPDYPNFGEYKVDPYAKGYVSATMKGIFNHRRGLDLLAHLDFVDPKRMGACGHSLGGHNSLFLAAFDERVKAVITSCGFNAFPKYYGGDLKGWSHQGYMPRIGERYHRSSQEVPFDFPEILGVIAPRAIFINAPTRDANFEVSGVRDCVNAARPVFEKIYRQGQRLVAEHPDAEHDFPEPVRERAYAFLASALGK